MTKNTLRKGFSGFRDGWKMPGNTIAKVTAPKRCFGKDERGERHKEQVFNNDWEAYNYLWSVLETLKKFYKV